jgi:hypothetical protein
MFFQKIKGIDNILLCNHNTVHEIQTGNDPRMGRF